MARNTKTRIDIGRPGDASTGDVLYRGGEKLNSNFDELFNVFGDERLFATDNGVGRQTLYGTGYYQFRDVNNFTCDPGGMYNVSVKSAQMNAILPGKAKLGDKVVIINSDGSVLPSRTLRVQPATGDSIIASPGGLSVTVPYTTVTLYCVATDGTRSSWNYSLDSMFGNRHLPIERTVALTTAATPIKIAHKNDFDVIKLMTVARLENETKMRSSEISVVIHRGGADKVYFTEYSVIKTDPSDELVKLDFKIDNNELVCIAQGLSTNTRFAIKSIATQTIGTATV